MMRRAGLACGVTLLAFGAAGCGGGGGSGGYTLTATQACLKKAGFQSAAVANQYLPGSEGNLRVRLTRTAQLLTPGDLSGSASRDEYVFLVFGKDPAAALATEQKAVTLTVSSFANHGVLMSRAAAKAGVGVTKNVFYYSAAGALTQHERTKVTACLR